MTRGGPPKISGAAQPHYVKTNNTGKDAGTAFQPRRSTKGGGTIKYDNITLDP